MEKRQTLDELMAEHQNAGVSHMPAQSGATLLDRIKGDRDRIRAEVFNEDMVTEALAEARRRLLRFTDAEANGEDGDECAWLTKIEARLVKVIAARRRARGL